MSVSVKSNTYLYLAILLFVVPLPWLCAWLIAVVFHELGHYLAVRLCGGTVYQLTVSIGGVNMNCGPMTDAKRVIAIVSGPIFGLALLAFYRVFPQLAICTWLLSAYNLLPILPLDGGRILQIIMSDGIWFYRLQKILLVMAFLIVVFAFLWLQTGPLPFVIAGILFVKHIKTPCKTSICRVQ